MRACVCRFLTQKRNYGFKGLKKFPTTNDLWFLYVTRPSSAIENFWSDTRTARGYRALKYVNSS